ncbi:MAG: hypothetical protein ACK2T5_18050 [Anaerolineales bacterium]
MLKIELFGPPQCRRYQKMRAAVQETAMEFGLDIKLQEINDSNQLAQSNPLDLPRLCLDGVVIAFRNPPKEGVLQKKCCGVLSGDQ